MNRGRPMQSSDVQLRVVHATDKGGVRGNNEDFYSVPPYTNLQPAPPRLSQAQFDRKGVLYVVADGMGGALSGEVASPMAVRTLVETYYRDPGEDLQTSLWRAFHEANLAVYRHSLTAPQFQGMGTTLTAMVLHGDTVYWANVGDSRLYRLRGGHLDRISKDHTYVQELVDKGVLTLEEARVHPQRNELKRAMGTQPEVDVDAGRVDLKVGDLFLLSSDGLHDELSDEQIRATLVQDPARSPQLLIQQAMLPQGGPDNITAVVVGVPRDEGLAGPATGIDLTRVLRQTAASLMVVTALVAFVKYKDRLLGAPFVAGPPTVVTAVAPTAATLEPSLADQATTAALIVKGQQHQARAVATDTAAPYPTGKPTPYRWRDLFGPKKVDPTVTVSGASTTATLITDSQVEPTEESKTDRKREPESTEKPTPEPEKPTPEPEKPTPEPEKPTPEPEKPTPEPEKPTPEPPPRWFNGRFTGRGPNTRWWNSYVDKFPPRGDTGTMRSDEEGQQREPISVGASISGDVRSPDEQRPVFGGSVFESGYNGNWPIGLIQFVFEFNPASQRIAGATLRIVSKEVTWTERGVAEDAIEWRVEPFLKAIHEESWYGLHYSRFNGRETLGVLDPRIRASSLRLQPDITLTLTCKQLENVSLLLAVKNNQATLGFRILGSQGNVLWYSNKIKETSQRPRLTLDLQPVEGHSPTPCPDSSQPTPTGGPTIQVTALPTGVLPAESPTMAQTAPPRSTPTAPPDTLTPSATASTQAMPVTRTPTPSRRNQILLPMVYRHSSGTVRLASCDRAVFAATERIVSVREKGQSQWWNIFEEERLTIVDLAVTPDCRFVFLAKWGQGVSWLSWSPGEHSNTIDRPAIIRGDSLDRYPYVLVADNKSVFYGATGSSGRGGVAQADLPERDPELKWNHLNGGGETMDVRSLRMTSNGNILVGSVDRLWGYSRSELEWTPVGGIANSIVKAILPAMSGDLPEYIGTDSRGLLALDSNQQWVTPLNWPIPSQSMAEIEVVEYEKQRVPIAISRDSGVWYLAADQRWLPVSGTIVTITDAAVTQDDLVIASRDGLRSLPLSTWLRR